MSSDHTDIWASIGTIASSILSVYGWLYSIGFMQLFMFIAGACFTILTQERLEKKRRKRNVDIKMTEHVYGPLHKELTSIFEGLRAFDFPPDIYLKSIIEDFRFGLAKEKIRYRVNEFRERLPQYTILYSLSHHETDFHIQMVLGKHEIRKVRFHLWVGNEETFGTNMLDPIFRDKTPLEFLTERARGYQNTSMIVDVDEKSEGIFSSEHRIHQISMDILMKVREDPSVKEQRREREYLLKECNLLIESIKTEIVL